MNDHFEMKNTFRIYNPDTLKKLNSTYGHMKVYYGNKNTFLSECITRGCESIENEFIKSNGIKNMSDLINEIKKHSDSIDALINLMRSGLRDIFKSSKINERLLNRSYSMLLGLTDSEPDVMANVLKGTFDDLPAGLEAAIEKLIKRFLQ